MNSSTLIFQNKISNSEKIFQITETELCQKRSVDYVMTPQDMIVKKHAKLFC